MILPACVLLATTHSTSMIYSEVNEGVGKVYSISIAGESASATPILTFGHTKRLTVRTTNDNRHLVVFSVPFEGDKPPSNDEERYHETKTLISIYDWHGGGYRLRQTFNQTGWCGNLAWSSSKNTLLVETFINRTLGGFTLPFRLYTLDVTRAEMTCQVEIYDPNKYMAFNWASDGIGINQLFAQDRGMTIVIQLDLKKRLLLPWKYTKSSFNRETLPDGEAGRIPVAGPDDWQYLMGTYLPDNLVAVKLLDKNSLFKTCVARQDNGQIVSTLQGVMPEEVADGDWVSEATRSRTFGFQKWLVNWRTGKHIPMPKLAD